MIDYPLPPDCKLRPAHPGDAKALLLLLKQLRQDTGARQDYGATQRYAGLAGILLIAIGLFRPVELLIILSAGLALGLLLGLLLWRARQAPIDCRDYWVIEHQGLLIACAKLVPEQSYGLLSAVFVLPAWRYRRLGSSLVKQLLQVSPHPVYAFALPRTEWFYWRLGFQRLAATPTVEFPSLLEPERQAFKAEYGHLPLIVMVLT
jgi:GNAT superfamily N-acetyltransferase